MPQFYMMIARKIFFPILFGAMHVFLPPVSCAYASISSSSSCVMEWTYLTTYHKLPLWSSVSIRFSAVTL